MKMFNSVLVNFLTFCGCAAWGRENAKDSSPPRFELCVVAHEAGPGVVARVMSGSDTSLWIKSSAVLSGADIRRAKAVTTSSWYVLSGSHRTSTLVLSLKPEVVTRFQATVSRAIGAGDRLAILLDGEILGILLPSQPLTTDEFAIDASFFSQGTEKQKESDTQLLARQIKSTLL